MNVSFAYALFFFFILCVCVCARSMTDKNVDVVDVGFKERAMPLEREYQRVSISGEEKCGVRISKKQMK